MSRNVVVGITGGSGAAYAVRLIEVLLASGWDVHLSISPSGQVVIQQELDLSIDLDRFRETDLAPEKPHGAQFNVSQGNEGRAAGQTPERQDADSHEKAAKGKMHYHHFRDMMAPIASGSFLTQGMVICPCSGGTLSAVAHGTSDNLIRRAAEVHLKERRKLVLVPRETPLSLPHIENMRIASLAGAVILPASPGWYHGATCLQDLIDFIVARICDQLEVKNKLIERWGDGK